MELKGQASAEQIASWKQQHKHVYELKVEDAICYLRKPSRQELSGATVLAASDPMKFNETLLNDCWLGGAEVIKNDDDYFLSASGLLGDLIETKAAELKKI